MYTAITRPKIHDLLVPSGKYSVKLASDTSEVRKALRLRFEVFNLELSEGHSSSYITGVDEDEYDQYCDHLIVVENANNNVIGTYRIQDSEMAANGIGFYTHNEFELTSFPATLTEHAVELGRACIHPDHRNGRVLYLLWKGIAQYLKLTNKRFLFGCCSIPTLDLIEVFSVYRYLEAMNRIHPQYHMEVKAEYYRPEPDFVSFCQTPELPKLFQLYLDIGVSVCSGPAFDKEFKTTDFLILLDKELLSPSYKALFLV